MTTLAMSSPVYDAGSVGAGPQLVSQLDGAIEVPEGDPVHLELRVAPAENMQIQWLKDGQILNAGSRFNTSSDRGLLALDIIYTFPEDSGVYTCVIANPFGTIQSNPVSVHVLAEIEPGQDQADAQWAAVYEAPSAPIHEYEQDKRGMPTSAPTFTKHPVISNGSVLEGEPVRIEAQLKTTSDTTLKIDWLKDGQPVGTGSRFNAFADRGLLILDIAYSLREDSGRYSCLASNAVGQSESNAVDFSCIPEERIVTKSILDQSSINHLRQLEEPGEEFSHHELAAPQGIPPSFRAPLDPHSIQVNEDEPVVFSVPVDCGNGDRLTVEWRRDDQIVKTGSRITGKLEMGIATLRIRYAQPSDAGTYKCHVTTEHGQATSEPATLTCEVSGNIIAACQLTGDKEKGLQAINDLEALLHAPRGTVVEDDGPFAAPTVVTQPQQVGDVEEGMTVHFEVQVEPANDASLTVQWYKDVEPLSSGTRFIVLYDRGIATLTLNYTIPEDSGDYWCKVKNAAGQTDSTKVSMNCIAGASIITQSNLLQGSEGYNLIKAIEAPLEGDAPEFRYEEMEEPDCPPSFDVKPQTVTIAEGAPIRFLVRVSGKPTPKLTWYLNDCPVEQDSLTKIFSDGAINYLEMSRCPALQGANILRVVAENPLGQSEATSTLTVVLAEDYRPGLKHVQPENPFKKMQVLRKVDCTPELNKALTRNKPSAQSIMEMERGTEMRIRTFRSPEVIEAEKMLDQLALSLRKSEIRRPPITNSSGTENGHMNHE